MESLTNTKISIYGKTVGIIGEATNVLLVVHAVERLLKGAKHGNIYAWIEKQKNQEKEI